MTNKEKAQELTNRIIDLMFDIHYGRQITDSAHDLDDCIEKILNEKDKVE